MVSFLSPLNLRVGFYLAVRQIRRASRWTTGLIVFVMLLTFLNLVVVTGVLVGLVEGINTQYRTLYTGDVVISALSTKQYVENAPAVLSFVRSLPQVEKLSARYISNGSVEANYKTRTNQNEKPNKTGSQIFGIDPVAEDALTNLSHYVIEGEYLEPSDYDQILIGDLLLEKYAFGEQPGISPLKNVSAGTKLLLTVNGSTREVTVKGVLKAKIDPLATSVYMTETEARQLFGRDDFNVSQIAIRLKEGSDPVTFRDLVRDSGVGAQAKVLTFEDSIPPGVNDIKNTFAMLGNMISSVGLVVASITIFIVIFINAVTRRKFIGILKGIGISGTAIELSYMFQSLFYALIGSAVGVAFLYGFLVPFVATHPIDFPFSDGILVAPVSGTLTRVFLLVIATVIAGYIPARMIVKKNTLDSILGRN